MRLGTRSFTPSLQITLLYTLFGGVMVCLGFWQLARANEKIEWQLAADQAASEAPVDITHWRAAGDAARYQRVELSGVLDTSKQLLWDNRTRQGQVGYEVITPVRHEDGMTVLLNRGWVPATLSRDNLPDVALTQTSLTKISGLMVRPSIGFSSGPAVEASDRWPKRLQHFAFDEIANALGSPVLPALMIPERGIDGAIDGLSSYPENFSPVAFGPQRHYGYAFQWFAMFAALSGLFFWLNLHPLEKPVADGD